MSAPQRAMPTEQHPGPGWFRDPREEGDPDEVVGYRWWDGEAWTAWLSDSAYAPFPRGETERVVPRPVAQRPRPAGWLLAVVAAAAVLLVLTGVSLVGQGLKPNPPEVERPAAMGPAPMLAQPLEVKDRTLLVRGRVEMTMADRFAVAPFPKKITGVLSECRLGDGQQRSDEKQSAQQMIGNLDPAVLDVDSAASARRAYQGLQRAIDQSLKVQWSQPTVEPHPTIPGAARLRGELRYGDPKPGTVPEQVTMVVVPWQAHGREGYAMWVSIVPDNAPADVKQAVERSERSIRLL